MSIYEQLRAALLPFGFPVANGIYTGTEDTYFTINKSTLPDSFADDVPTDERNLVMVHLFCPHTRNTVELCRQIKRTIADADFSYPASTDATDSTAQHIVFECEKMEEI